MPGFDQTGPIGAGAMTGGGRGICRPANAGYDPRFTTGVNYGRGMGLRRGFRGGFGPGQAQRRGFGRGYRWDLPDGGPAYTMDASDEIDMLKANAQSIKNSLEAIMIRIEKLEKLSESL